MKIGTTNSTAPLIGDKQEAANKANQGLDKKGNQKTREDQLNISSQARELQKEYNDKLIILTKVEDGHNNKLNQIRKKISNNYYDQPQTRIEIAARLSDDKEILREFYKSIY